MNNNNNSKSYNRNNVLGNINEINYFEGNDLNNMHNKTFNFGKNNILNDEFVNDNNNNMRMNIEYNLSGKNNIIINQNNKKMTMTKN